MITVYRLPIKENKLPFSVYTYIETAAYIQIYIYMYIYIYIYTLYIYTEMYIYTSTYMYLYLYLYNICCGFKRKTEAQAIFLNPFTVCSPCKWKFIVRPFVYEEINGLQTDQTY